MTFEKWPAILAAGLTAAYAADPAALWDQAIQAKGGRERLRGVRTLAVYMKPAQIQLTGPLATWLFVFPNRYFEYDGRGSGSYPYVAPNGVAGMAGNPRAIVVDATVDKVAMDANGSPRVQWRLSSIERDRLILNQLVFLLETAWLQPLPVSVKHNELTVQAGGRNFLVRLDADSLPDKISFPRQGGSKVTFDYRLQHYRDFQGIEFPTRVTWTSRVTEATWDVDYEVNGKYNPKLFERPPDLAEGPEPWRRP